MKSTREKILKKIEQLRHELETLIQEHDELHNTVILQKSQELDQWLNAYSDLIKKEGK